MKQECEQEGKTSEAREEIREDLCVSCLEKLDRDDMHHYN